MIHDSPFKALDTTRRSLDSGPAIAADPLATLAALPRVQLAPLPTPLQRADRLGRQLGAEIWIKRDDIGSIGLAGNKVRKLEFALGEALSSGCDSVVTCGAAQSNHARATATAAAALGLRSVIVMRGREPGGTPTGNLLLDRLVGTEIRFTGTESWTELNAAVTEVASELEAEGHKPYAMPTGCSTPVGVLGFVAAYCELLRQLGDLGVDAWRVYHASTSGGTHAGLLLGETLAERGPSPYGFDVGRLYPDMATHIAGLATDAARLLGSSLSFGPEEIEIDESQIGSRYGAFTDQASAAIRLAARLEGVLFDPVYSGKALAGLVACARESPGPVVIWHTGGAQALFADGFAASLLQES